MNLQNILNSYWTSEQIFTNFIIFLNLLGALLLGMTLGLERTIRGRAAGLRTYGLVAAASCAMTVFAGYPHQWFGGVLPTYFQPDPTRVIQGVVTGVGFLGAGVIMKDGFSISGLSTAASIWMCSAIGILIGVGFYSAGIALTLMSILTMALVSKIESKLPQQNSFSVSIVFIENYEPNEEMFQTMAYNRGFLINENAINVSMKNRQIIWRFNANSIPDKNVLSLTEISNELSKSKEIVSFDISRTRM